MRALVLPAPGRFEIQEAPVPQPGGGGGAVQGAGRGHLRQRSRNPAGRSRGQVASAYPFIPGHEWSGQVVAVGPGVVNLKVGDAVAGQAHKGCGYCRNCLAGRYTICEHYGRPETGHRHYGFITQGAYAQYIAISVKSVNLMPKTMTFREGALVDTAGVVLHGLELCGVTPGGTVAVIGPGPIGLIAMRLARALGRSPHRRRRARRPVAGLAEGGR